MRIGKEHKPCEVKFGNGLKIGEAFYYKGEYDNKEEIYMKISEISYEKFGNGYNYNAVNLEDGSLEFVGSEQTVTIANVHIEKD